MRLGRIARADTRDLIRWKTRRARGGDSKRKTEVWSFPAGRIASDTCHYTGWLGISGFWFGRNYKRLSIEASAGRGRGGVGLWLSLRRRLRNWGHVEGIYRRRCSRLWFYGSRLMGMWLSSHSRRGQAAARCADGQSDQTLTRCLSQWRLTWRAVIVQWRQQKRTGQFLWNNVSQNV